MEGDGSDANASDDNAGSAGDDNADSSDSATNATEEGSSYTPDPGLSAAQAFAIYPAFLYLVWLGVEGLSDEVDEVKEELNEIRRKVGDKKLSFAEMKVQNNANACFVG